MNSESKHKWHYIKVATISLFLNHTLLKLLALLFLLLLNPISQNRQVRQNGYYTRPSTKPNPRDKGKLMTPKSRTCNDILQVTDPRAPEIQEGAGAVASDSLAAESTREGGGFSSNKNSEPLGVSGANSTFANTNTSGATTLSPAINSEARDIDSGTYPDALGGQSKDTTVEDTTRGSSGNAGVAPTYVNSQFVDESGPKGKNLTEGGFTDSDGKNASFNGQIGRKNDPGRLAEEKFVRDNANASESAGMPLQGGDTGYNSFDALGGETSA
jgi:hypothetical protein